MKILVGYKGINVGKKLLDIAVRHATAFDGVILIVTSGYLFFSSVLPEYGTLLWINISVKLLSK